MFPEKYQELNFRLMWEQVGAPFELFAGNVRRSDRGKEEFLYARDGWEAELSRFKENLALDAVDIFYLYGLGLGWHFSLFKQWLHKDPSKKLIVIEDDLAVIDIYRRSGEKELLTHPQVDLHFLEKRGLWKDFLKQCSFKYSGKRPEAGVMESYARSRKKRKIETIQKELFSYHGLHATYLSEAICAHTIHHHLFENLKHLPHSFDARAFTGAFNGVPAIICGAGPSLGNYIQELQQVGDRALIVAGGSAVPALGNFGVVPHFSMAIDPNLEEKKRFEESVIQETAFIYGLRIHPGVFDTLNAPLGYLPTGTCGSGEKWVQEHLGMGPTTCGEDMGAEALSITTLAVSFAHRMGCNPIILVGVDLGLPGMKRYAEGVTGEAIDHAVALDKKMLQQDGSGKPLYTLVRWMMEARALSSFAKKRKSVRFFRVGNAGLPIAGIPVIGSEEFLRMQTLGSLDLRGKIHEVIQGAMFPQEIEEKSAELKASLVASLKHSQRICQEILRELQRIDLSQQESFYPTGTIIGLTFKLEEEIAFKVLLIRTKEMIHHKLHQEKPGKTPALLDEELFRNLLSVIDYYLVHVFISML